MAICTAMHNQEPLTVSLNREGPDVRAIGLEDLIVEASICFDYNLGMVQFDDDCNLLQDSVIATNYSAPMQFVQSIQEHMAVNPHTVLKEIQYHYGHFVGRGNQHRLDLAVYLYTNYREHTLQTYHYSPRDDFHKDNAGIEDLLTKQDTRAIDIGAFVEQCPFTLNQPVTYPILMDQHLLIAEQYQNFFVEIVSESYFSGSTFFPTEKTWRAISQRTPFIIQGPQNYLANLRRLGFQTFDRWWDEGYAEDPADWQTVEIKRVIDGLARHSTGHLQHMYWDMMPVLNHNYARLQELTKEDFIELSNDK